MGRNGPRYGMDAKRVKSLSSVWSREKLLDNSVWGNFDAFLRWCSQQETPDYRSNLLRRDETKPHGPGNSYWGKRKRGHYQKTMQVKYDNGNPCKVCPKEERCYNICAKRADYWDRQMEIVRRQCGVATEVATEIATVERRNK